MVKTCLKRFKVAVEVADFVCYIKYIDKKDNGIPEELVDDLYELVKVKDSVSKNDISKVVSHYTHKLAPSMLKEEKFNLSFDCISDKFITNDEGLKDTYNNPFVINMKSDMVKRFHKDEFMNHFTDIHRDSLFLMDIRYYGIEKKYYEVPFELYLSEDDLFIESTEPIYVEKLLENYTIEDVVESLEINQNLLFKGNVLTTESSSNGSIVSLHAFTKKSILEQLVEIYDSSECIFINNVFLKSLSIGYDDLIKPHEKSKLMIVLEENEYSYFDKQATNKVERIEYRDNNTILYISEHVFRESIGNSTYILMMNDMNHVTLNQMEKADMKFTYIVKRNNKNMNLFRNILEKYFENKRMNSYIDNLLLLTYAMEEEELNSNLNFYLANTLKSNRFSLLKFSQDSRDALPFDDLKKLIHVYYLAQQLNKTIVLSSNNISLILNDMMTMIRKLTDLESIVEFISTKKEVIQIFNIDEEMYEEELSQIMTLIHIKQIIIAKEQNINYILDSSVLLDEPDLVHKYFNDKSIVIPSIIKEELENNRVHNINALRAIRNINMLRNDPSYKFQYIPVENIVGDLKKPAKVKVFEDLLKNFSRDGNISVLVSNEMNNDLYKNNKESIIQLKHLPLLFK